MTVTPIPLAVRAVLALAGLALVLAPPHLHIVPALITGVGVGLALTAPVRVGPSVAVTGFVIGWLAATGWHGTGSDTRTILAAAGLYVLHSSASLAAVLPLRADVEAAVLTRWLRRSVPVVLVAAALIAVDVALPRAHGSPVFVAVGLGAAVVVLGVATRTLWLPARSDGRPR
jgi:hypothetical protein